MRQRQSVLRTRNPDVTIELKEVACFTHIETLEQTDATNEDVADVFAIPADRLVSLGKQRTDRRGGCTSHGS